MRNPTPIRRGRHRESGAALLTVLVFALIFAVVGLAFLTLSGYELGATIYRDDSSEAFFAADGGVEAAKAEFFKDRTWRAGFPSPGVSIGPGTYIVRVVDTTFTGGPYVDEPTVAIESHGYFGKARRDLLVFGNPNVATYDLAIYARHQIQIGGSAEIDGLAHADGCFAKNNGDCWDDETMLEDSHCTDGDCSDQFTHGFPINPPRAYTEPDSFPGCTYYYVNCYDLPGPPPPVAEIRDRNNLPFVPPRYVPVTMSGSDYDFNLAPADFDTSASAPYFPIAPGDVSVVVNFGEYVEGGGIANIDMGSSEGTITSTIINSKFIGVTLDDRLNTLMWVGGELDLRGCRVRFEPTIGLTMIVHDIPGANAQVYLGTDDGGCGMTYVTHDMHVANGGINIYGTVICLNDLELRGDANVVWDPCFLEKVPGWARYGGPGTSGLFEVLLWKELPTGN